MRTKTRSKVLDISSAQAELRRSYMRGGPGAIVSSVVWFVAAVTADYSSVHKGFAVLFFGGMLIYPISTAFLRHAVRLPATSKENPGGLTVTETVFPMIGCLFAAWLLLPYRPDFVFPLAAIAVGTHYFGFRTAYGDWSYWVLGGLVTAVGSASIIAGLPSAEAVPYLIAATELVFGCWICWMAFTAERRELKLPSQENS